MTFSPLKTLFLELKISVLLIVLSLLICSVLYPFLIFGVGQVFSSHTANGWILRDPAGKIIGSEIIAQKFTQPEYFWPRPSAVDYNGAGAGGSNWAASNPALRKRVIESLTEYQKYSKASVPVDLVLASGSGLDPHISLMAAEFQIPRIAQKRHISKEVIIALLQQQIASLGPFSESYVNVLLLNHALDQLEDKN